MSNKLKHKMHMITLEQIQEKIGGKLWEKAGKRRVYLDRGYNTKKMKTTTCVEMTETGYVVKCFIECPSQDWNWIKSQQNQVIEGVESDIENMIAQQNVVLVDYKINEAESTCEVLVKKTEDSEPIWMDSDAFDECFGTSPDYLFGGELELKMDEVREKARIARQSKKEAETQSEPANELPITHVLGDGQKVNHSRFGLGEVLTVEGDKTTVLFEKHGEKNLHAKFSNLEYLS